MEIFFHHGIPQLMNFNRLLKFGFIFESNTPQKHIKERLLQLAVHQLTNLDGISLRRSFKILEFQVSVLISISENQLQ